MVGVEFRDIYGVMIELILTPFLVPRFPTVEQDCPSPNPCTPYLNTDLSVHRPVCAECKRAERERT